MSEFQYIGHGVYGFAEAQRLTGVPKSTIRRWTRGYTYRHGKNEYYSPPVIGVQDPSGVTALRFADLMEVRVLDQFRRAGIPWTTMRIAVDRAIKITRRTHPFSHRDFVTDGRSILLRVADGVLLDVVSDQHEFEKIVAPFLFEGIDYEEGDDDGGVPLRWWPMGRDRLVVLDPARSFGAPICSKGGVPTSIISTFYETEREVDTTAWWYGITPLEVEDAVAFEHKLAA